MEERRKRILRSREVTVTHVLFEKWPDHFAPAEAGPTIAVLNVVRQRGGPRPVVVHCSAGVGRTCTFVGE